MISRLSFQKPRPQPLIITIEFDEVNPAVFHLVIGCPQDWPHSTPCFFNNIILGEE